MNIYLVRHGETDWNKQLKIQGREDIPLNQTGINQAKECGEAFRDIHLDCIISSPLKRARETAEWIASYQHNVSVLMDEGFIERDYGKLSGLTLEEREAFCKSGKPDEMETHEVLLERIMKSLQTYLMREYQNILIVSHGAAINSTLALLSNNEIGSGKTRLKNACINVLQSNGTDIKILQYNLTAEEFKKMNDR